MPTEFKPNTFYWVKTDIRWYPLLLDINMEWRIDSGPIYSIPHNTFIAICGPNTVIVEAILPT